tara:strand:- start:443 stop:742 length:300 start_codon:yes stop_codon:yes gene_type:complete
MRHKWKQAFTKIKDLKKTYNYQVDPRDVFIDMDISEKTEFFREIKSLKHESKGLGDTIEKITKATGIKSAVDSVFKVLDKDCGCNNRKKFLNKIVPYEK